VVGIGASAGGLEAINELFDNFPENTNFAFVIVQHLSPDYKSLMGELLVKAYFHAGI
jgi:two-component system CheB/CheR fusion protein